MAAALMVTGCKTRFAPVRKLVPSPPVVVDDLVVKLSSPPVGGGSQATQKEEKEEVCGDEGEGGENHCVGENKTRKGDEARDIPNIYLVDERGEGDDEDETKTLQCGSKEPQVYNEAAEAEIFSRGGAISPQAGALSPLPSNSSQMPSSSSKKAATLLRAFHALSPIAVIQGGKEAVIEAVEDVIPCGQEKEEDEGVLCCSGGGSMDSGSENRALHCDDDTRRSSTAQHMTRSTHREFKNNSCGGEVAEIAVEMDHASSCSGVLVSTVVTGAAAPLELKQSCRGENKSASPSSNTNTPRASLPPPPHPTSTTTKGPSNLTLTNTSAPRPKSALASTITTSTLKKPSSLTTSIRPASHVKAPPSPLPAFCTRTLKRFSNPTPLTTTTTTVTTTVPSSTRKFISPELAAVSSVKNNSRSSSLPRALRPGKPNVSASTTAQASSSKRPEFNNRVVLAPKPVHAPPPNAVRDVVVLGGKRFALVPLEGE